MRECEVWYDFETTGLKHDVHGACQLAMVVVLDGEVVEEYVTDVDISSYPREVVVNAKALEINKRSKVSLTQGKSIKKVVADICKILAKHFPRGKARLLGYNNSTFDRFFMEDFFEIAGVDYWKWFKWKQIDVFELVKALQFMGAMGPTFNQKLGTIVKYLGIEVKGDLHDALADVHATRDIYLKIKVGLNG
jgi:DNA polymerase III epsilon subunit-like protein